ncbi:hypothetical protein [Streptomyces lavendulocolor]|uniref:hypothetical protein n=1 Tax=Streptomyces lavendulocolor TaxID=67316 RepID=UPI003C2B0841
MLGPGILDRLELGAEVHRAGRHGHSLRADPQRQLAGGLGGCLRLTALEGSFQGTAHTVDDGAHSRVLTLGRHGAGRQLLLGTL